jgi:uncharacterized protein (TIGR03086 family)
MNFAELDDRALAVCEAIVGQVDIKQLNAPTPCGDWDLGRLLAHMVGQNRGYAAAARNDTLDLKVFDPVPVGDEPATLFAASAEDVRVAFSADDRAESFWLPQIRENQLIAAAEAMSLHFVACVVHAWDVAVSIDVPVKFDDDLLAAALTVAENVPDGDGRDTQGAAFKHRVAVADDAPALDRIVARLGRDPSWTPAPAQEASPLRY